MKVYGLPEELEATLPGMLLNWRECEKAEEAHKETVKQWLIENGYDGPNTGREYRSPVADGHARYMYADRKGSPILVHLPYGSGWQARDIEFIPAREIIKRMNQQDKRNAWFREQAAKRKAG